jgi:hypothetical protein
MKTAALWRSVSTLEKTAPTANDAEYALRIVLVYQDDQTRKWAAEVCTRVRQLAGEESVRPTWLNLRSFNQPAVLADAISQASRADVIVVAIRAAAELPLAFYYWADAWVPHRSGEPGALVALIGLPEQQRGDADETRDCLRALARRGRLDLMVEERRLPEPSIGVAPAPRGGLSAAAPHLHARQQGLAA